MSGKVRLHRYGQGPCSFGLYKSSQGGGAGACWMHVQGIACPSTLFDTCCFDGTASADVLLRWLASLGLRSLEVWLGTVASAKAPKSAASVPASCAAWRGWRTVLSAAAPRRCHAARPAGSRAACPRRACSSHGQRGDVAPRWTLHDRGRLHGHAIDVACTFSLESKIQEINHSKQSHLRIGAPMKRLTTRYVYYDKARAPTHAAACSPRT